MTTDRSPSDFFVALAVGLVGIEVITGLVEAVSYRPNAKDAYDSIVAMRHGFLGAHLAALHYWTSAALIVATSLALLVMLWKGEYADRRRWYSTLALALISFIGQVSGNLLPMDRHGVQTAVVESGITGSVPGLGQTLRHAILGGNGFGPQTLARWWLGHAWIVPVVAVSAAALLFPAAWTKRPKSVWGALGAIVVLSLLVAAPLGKTSTPDDYTSYNANVSWYTWVFHGLLTSAGKLSTSMGWIGWLGFPLVCLLFLLFIPFLPIPQKLVRTVAGVALAIALLAGILFGGPVARLTGNRDPVDTPLAANGSRKPPTDPALLKLVADGRGYFNDPNVGCASCHGTDGVNGDSGPNLSKEWKKHADVGWYSKLMRNPRSVSPSATMPAFPNLSQNQVDAIGTYLSEPRAGG